MKRMPVPLGAAFRRTRRQLHRWMYAAVTGQGLVEYGLVLVLIAVAVIGVVTLLGGQVSGLFVSIGSRVAGAVGP